MSSFTTHAAPDQATSSTAPIDSKSILIDAIPQIVYIAQSDGAFDYVNQRWYEFTGTCPETALGLSWMEWVHPDDRKRIVWPSGCNDERHFEVECRLRNANGDYYWHLAQAQPIGDEAGQSIQWFGTLTDIHRVKQNLLPSSVGKALLQPADQASDETSLSLLYQQLAEKDEKLKRSEARFQALIKASQQVVWSWDRETQKLQSFDLLDWEQTITGQSPQAENREYWLELVHAEDRERIETTWRQAVENGNGYQIEYRMLTPQGEYAYIVETAAAAQGEDGNTLEFVGTVMNVTQQRLAEQKEVIHLRLFRAIAETVPDILFLFDPRDRHIFYVNHAIVTILGYTPEEIQGWGQQLLQRLIHPDETSQMALHNAQSKTLKDNEIVEHQYRFRHANGSYRWLKTRTLIFSRNTQGEIDQLLGVAQDITAEVEAAEALQTSNQKIRSILESTSDGYLAIDREWRVIYANQRALQGARLPAEAVIGQNVWKVFHNLLGTPYETAIRTVMEQRTPTEFEMPLVLVHGWLAVKCFPSPEGIVVYSQDISERKLAEERFYQLFEAALNGVALVDTDGKIQMANAPFERLFGYAHAELVGQPIDILVPTELQHRHAAFRLQYGTHPLLMVNNERDLYGLRKDGRLFPIETSLIPITTLQDRVTLCMVTDISARKAAEASLRQSEERLRLATELGKIGFFDHDFQENRSYFSPLNYVVTQYPRDLPITRESWLNYVYPDDRPIIEDVFRNARLTGLPSQNQYRVVWPDQSIHWLQNSTITLKNQAGEATHLMGVVRDITEYKEIEATLRGLNQSLEQLVQERTAQYATANKELEAFAYSVSHDLRAPLRAMTSFSEILLNEFAQELSDKPRHYLRRIHYNGAQMGLLIDDLLTFSRLSRQSLVRQKVDLTEVVQQVMDDLSQELGQREIEFSLSPLPPCQADPILLKQVIVNLLSNALKYTRKRQPTNIHVGWQVGTPPGMAGEQTIYFVQDNGVGFDMRYADKLFQVFQRLHSSTEYEGTGIGLAIVQRIVHRHGGEVWAEAEVDKGATIYFYLASTRAESEAQGELNHG
ncbi:MAG: PAS domain S-box protein [Caldilineaceae bacterium]